MSSLFKVSDIGQWFHVPTFIQTPPDGQAAPEGDAVQALIEKKTIINLIGRFFGPHLYAHGLSQYHSC